MNSRIMIVEDERIVALDLTQILESFGHEVVAVAASGEQAIFEATRHAPDLILMDIHLQGDMDGTTAALEIRNRLRIPVIFLTAFTEERILERAEASVPYGYLVKPVESRELGATLRMAIARRHAEAQVEQAEERLRLAMDAAELGVLEWDTDTGRLNCGGHIDDILGRRPASLVEGPEAFLALIHPEDRPAIAAAIEERRPICASVRIRRKNGGQDSERWIDINARVYPGPHPRLVGVLRDVTTQHLQQGQLQQAAVVFRTTAEGIAILDPDRRVVSVNPAFEALTGHSAEAVIGRDPAEFLHARRHTDSFYPDLQETGRGYWSMEINCRRSDGGVFPAWQNLCAVVGDDGELVNYVLTLTDISAIRRAEAELNHLAFHDPLTGLGNRNMLKNMLAEELPRARAQGERVAVLFLDLDGFKLINDTMGHARGDRILRIVADRISGLVRRSDTAIRLGGDEFVIVMPGVGRLEDCAGLADKLLAELRADMELDFEHISLTGSIGIAVFPDDADNQDDLITAADNAMYSAKHRSRNRYAFYSAEMAEHAMARLQVEQGLARALAKEELTLFFQPVVALADARLVGFEALLRWFHPLRGLVCPEQFIHVAEDCGLIESIGEWVLRSACRQGRAWLAAGYPPVRLAVNVSVRQLGAEGFVEMVRAALNETGFPAALLELEITESSLQTVEHSKELLARIKHLGPSISIDDFGTGFSSLSLLKHLPIDRIKIDRAFIRELPDDQNDVELTRAIVALAKILDLKLIAEGVESTEQQEFLRALGCEEAQGFLYSRPLNADDAAKLLKTQPGSH